VEGAIAVDPVATFQGKVVVVSPHMDDEVLACGGLLALLPDKGAIRIVYTTDGMRSPAPVLPWGQSITPDLGRRRMLESRHAVGVLGIPTDNLSFLGLPEARLRRHRPELGRMLLQKIEEWDPDHVLLPFRYDRHPDHLAVNDLLTRAQRAGVVRARLTEYFVYHRWRLLPKRDVRRYVQPRYLLKVDIEAVAAQKRAALACFTTQTTRFYDWQTRPILTPELLDSECSQPELFLRADPTARGPAVFSHAAPWIRIVHRVEPVLQKWKYLTKSALLGAFRGSDGDSR
jgi:LmbE family N-acetylglucosaminyl deacetylase